MKNNHAPGPMPVEKAGHLLNPLRNIILSPKKLLSRLGLKRSATVLELGPGPGYFSPAVAKSVPEGKLILVDVQQEMLDMAKERLDKKGIGKVECLKGDATSIPVESGSIDVAFLVAMLGEVPDREACLRDIHRVLVKNGLLSVTEIKLGDPDFIPKSEMVKLAESAGFHLFAQYRGFFHYTINFIK